MNHDDVGGVGGGGAFKLLCMLGTAWLGACGPWPSMSRFEWWGYLPCCLDVKSKDQSQDPFSDY